MRAWPRASIRNLQRILWDIEKNVFSSRFDLLQLFSLMAREVGAISRRTMRMPGEEVCGRVQRRALRRWLGCPWRQRRFKKNELDDSDAANAMRKKNIRSKCYPRTLLRRWLKQICQP